MSVIGAAVVMNVQAGRASPEKTPATGNIPMQAYDPESTGAKLLVLCITSSKRQLYTQRRKATGNAQQAVVCAVRSSVLRANAHCKGVGRAKQQGGRHGVGAAGVNAGHHPGGELPPGCGCSAEGVPHHPVPRPSPHHPHCCLVTHTLMVCMHLGGSIGWEGSSAVHKVLAGRHQSGCCRRSQALGPTAAPPTYLHGCVSIMLCQ